MLSRTLVAVTLITAILAVTGPAAALPDGTRVQTYRGNLATPIDMAWVRGTNKIYFTEKNTGRVRVMRGKNLLKRPCVDLPVSPDGERGALGITLHPEFKRNHYLYVYYTDNRPVVNKVVRFEVRNDRCRDAKRIITVPAGSGTNHNGGQLEFAGGKLYVSVGDAGDPANSQNKNSRAGKILRVLPGGGIPGSNPFGSAVWSYGHRNPFGLAHKPGTSKVFETENGPDCDDEMNVLKRGRNYGWGPGYRCGTAGVGPNPKPPAVRWSDVIVPTDLGWYSGRLRALRGLLGADYARGRLHRFVMRDGGNRVKKDRIVYNGGTPIVDVAEGPGRWVYFLTTDAIMRIVRR